MEVSTNIIQLLLARDLTRIVFEIYSYLDSLSLIQCKLVCHDWKDFIDHHFHEIPKGTKWLQIKLTENFLNPQYEPRTLKAKSKTPEKFFAVVADEKSVCVTTLNGSLINYKFHTLEELWTLKICDHDIQHCMSEDRVFAVTSNQSDENEGSHIYIIDRENGRVLNHLKNVHSHSILGVQVYLNSILASADSSGNIKFHLIGTKELTEEPKLKFEKQVYRGQQHGITHLDGHGDRLVSGSSNGEIIAWDFETGQEIHKVQSKIPIMTLKVKWPLVVTCTTDFNHQETFKGVKLFNMETETLVRHINCGYATDVDIKGDILFICGSYLSYRHFDLMDNAHQFWSLSQLLDESLKLENVKHRKIKTNPSSPLDATRICALVGSNLLTTEGQYLMQMSFWP